APKHGTEVVDFRGASPFNLFNLVNGILWLSLMVIFLKDKQMGNSHEG
ncbi:hypothetical protein ACUODF_19480, partial [Escherichia coli]